MIYKVYYPGELYHHGILGQRWGVRRFQNKDGTRTEAGKKRYSLSEAYAGYEDSQQRMKRVAQESIDNNKAYANARNGRERKKAFKKGVELTKEYARLRKEGNPVKDNEILIKSGDEFVRVSLKNKEDDDRRMYVSYNKDNDSVDYYTNEWPAYLRKFAGNSNAEVYKNTYKVKTDIIAPSLEKRRDIALSLIKADKKILTELGKTYALDQVILSNRDENVGLKTLKEVKNKATTKYGKEAAERYQKMYDYTLDGMKYATDDKYFRAFNASIPKSEKLMNAYIKELKKDGYNAVFDDNSYSPAPFIVFNPKDFEQTSSRKLTSVSNELR